LPFLKTVFELSLFFLHRYVRDEFFPPFFSSCAFSFRLNSVDRAPFPWSSEVLDRHLGSSPSCFPFCPFLNGLLRPLFPCVPTSRTSPLFIEDVMRQAVPHRLPSIKARSLGARILHFSPGPKLSPSFFSLFFSKLCFFSG